MIYQNIKMLSANKIIVLAAIAIFFPSCAYSQPAIVKEVAANMKAEAITL